MSLESDIVHIENERLLNLMSIYLNDAPDSVTREDIEALREFDIPVEEAFALTLAGLFDLDIAANEGDRRFYESYFPYMFHRFDKGRFDGDPYLANIEFPSKTIGSSTFAIQSYAPYEAFVCDDFHTRPDGRIVPQIGFFEEEYRFPTVMENGRIWMSVTPQEILTIAPAVKRAHGKVLTYGLGLGYFAYMAAIKPEVESVTVVECNLDIIHLFEECLLPQFGRMGSGRDEVRGGAGGCAGAASCDESDSCGESGSGDCGGAGCDTANCAGKVDVVYGDAFEYAEHEMGSERFDFVYGDIWHDVGDGFDLYLRMREYEEKLPSAEFMYWLEPTIKCYM